MYINIRTNLFRFLKKDIFKKRKSNRDWVLFTAWIKICFISLVSLILQTSKRAWTEHIFNQTTYTNRKADSCTTNRLIMSCDIFENTRQLPRWIMTGSSWQSKHKMPIQMAKNGDAAELKNQVSASTAKVSYSGTHFLSACVCLCLFAQ